MFRSNPDKSTLIDQLDVQIEEHRRISTTLEKEYEASKKDVESLVKKGLKRAAKVAYKGLTNVKNQLEAIEINRIQLRMVRTQLIAQPDRLPSKTLQGVDKILRDSQSKILNAQSLIQPLIERTTLVTEMTLDIPESDTYETDDGFEDFLQEIGLGEKSTDETQKIEYSLPEIPQETPSTATEQNEKGKEKLEEDNL